MILTRAKKIVQSSHHTLFKTEIRTINLRMTNMIDKESMAIVMPMSAWVWFRSPSGDGRIGEELIFVVEVSR